MSDLITRLGDFGSPTILNALEILGEDPDDGFTDGTLRMLTAEGAVFVGRALTATMVSAGPRPSPDVGVATEDYWRYLRQPPGPQHRGRADLHRPAGIMYGEVRGQAASVARRRRDRDQRCGARPDRADPDRLPSIGSKPAVSHAHARFVEIDVPVIVGGVEVSPATSCMRHGVQSIPAHIDLAELVRVARPRSRRARQSSSRPPTGALASTVPVDLADVHGRWPERNDGSPEGPPGIPPP